MLAVQLQPHLVHPTAPGYLLTYISMLVIITPTHKIMQLVRDSHQTAEGSVREIMCQGNCTQTTQAIQVRCL